jgi:hypothetical protein
MALSLARWWATEHGLASITLCDEHDVARKRGQFLDAVPPSIGELSSWPERLEHPPSMAWL